MFCLVLTYGVPRDPHRDPNLTEYAKQIVQTVLRMYPHGTATLLLNGGATSPTNTRTEADAMAEALRAQLQRHDAETRVRIPVRARPATALDLRTSLHEYWKLQHACGDPVTIFCEKHRAARTRVVAASVFGNHDFTIVPIDFDAREYTPLDHATRWLEVVVAHLSVHIPGFYRHIEWRLRMRKIGRLPNGTRRP